MIAGRPNVGKSRLFNRLIGKKQSLVADIPGLTRDYQEGLGVFSKSSFLFIDTPGLDGMDEKFFLTPHMHSQVHDIMRTCHVVLFLVDGRMGLTHHDSLLVQQIRKRNNHIQLVVNKCENETTVQGAYEFYALSLGDPLLVSAEHGNGMHGLFSSLEGFDCLLASQHNSANNNTPQALESSPLTLTVVGRPNVGKSTLLNAFIKKDRFIAHHQAGTTRDATTTTWTHGGRVFSLVDTPGMNKKNPWHFLESLMTQKSLRALAFSHVVVLVLDGTQNFHRHDAFLSNLILKEGRSLIIALNKWDMVSKHKERLHYFTKEVAPFFSFCRAPIVPVSALYGKNIERLLDQALHLESCWDRSFSTSSLNAWLQEALRAHAPPLAKGKRIKLKYIAQIKSRPPTFKIFGNQLHELAPSYIRYLQNSLQESFSLEGTALRFVLKNAHNPYSALKNPPRNSSKKKRASGG